MTSILAANALTTYAAAKSRLSVNQAAIVDLTDQAEVERLINAVSAAVESQLGRSLCRATATELYPPPRGEQLQLDRWPVSEELADAPVVLLDGETITGAELEDAARGILHLDGGWRGEQYEQAVPGSVTLATRPGTARRVLSVTYKAGYVTPGQEDSSATGGATLDTRTGSGVGVITGAAGALATGTLVLDVDLGGTPCDFNASWNGGPQMNLRDVAFATLQAGVDLGSVDSDLAGLTWTLATLPVAASLAESWDVVPNSPATRTLPWDLEEAVLVAVAQMWRQRASGYAGDAMTLDEVLETVETWLAPYRRGGQ